MSPVKQKALKIRRASWAFLSVWNLTKGINTFSQATHLTVSPLQNGPTTVTKSIQRVTQPLTICSLSDRPPTEPPGRQPADKTADTPASHKNTLVYTLSQHTQTHTRLYLQPLPQLSQPGGAGRADTRSSAVSLRLITVICELYTLRMN